MSKGLYKLSVAQKRKIVTFCGKNKKLSYQKAANVMSDVLGINISKMHIYRALRQKERILNAPNFGHGYQVQSELYQKFERELFVRLKNVKIITQSVVINLAMALKERSEYRESRFNNSKLAKNWYLGFCKRYQLQSTINFNKNFNKMDEDFEISVEEIDTEDSEKIFLHSVVII